MAQEVRNLTNEAETESVVFPSWVNNVNAKFAQLEGQIANLSTRLAEAEAGLSPFKLTPISGLLIGHAGGSVVLPSRLVVNIAPGNFQVEEGFNYVYVDSTDTTVKASVSQPGQSYEIGTVTVTGGVVTEVVNFPLARIRDDITSSDLDDYVKAGDLEQSSWKRVVSATLKDDFTFGKLSDNDGFNVLGEYHVIPFVADFTADPAKYIFKNNGEFSVTVSGELYAIHAQVRLYEQGRNLEGKISAFISPALGELGGALSQAESASGDMVLNASNAVPRPITPNDVATVKAYLTRGDRTTTIKQGSSVTIWKVPTAN